MSKGSVNAVRVGTVLEVLERAGVLSEEIRRELVARGEQLRTSGTRVVVEWQGGWTTRVSAAACEDTVGTEVLVVNYDLEGAEDNEIFEFNEQGSTSHTSTAMIDCSCAEEGRDAEAWVKGLFETFAKGSTLTA